MTNPIEFFKETRAELTKVVWPTRQEAMRITLAVIILCIVMAIFLGLVDYGLTQLVELFLNR